ncbi:MAG: type III-A CRISPR-associated protein Csm2 [Candidatus Diapherotrites archaeon]|nr:type III-A CRISPR-associated protein Csm2 [Candidatus Diapherotrites archaeon]
MVQLYKDKEQGLVNEDLFDSYARKVAKDLIELGLPSSQFRKFFGELRALEARIRSQGDDDVAVRKEKPYMKLLLAKIHYQTRDRKKADAYIALEKFLRDLIDQVETRKDFDVLMDAVQAVLAYYTPRARG